MSDKTEIPDDIPWPGMEEFTKRYLQPACEDLMRRVMAGEPISPIEEKLVRSLGRESASWALNVQPDPRDS